LLPFIIAVLAILHLILLHIVGSSNPLGVEIIQDRIRFHPYYVIKDWLGYIIAITLFFILLFIKPNILGHPDNYIKANPLVTPIHIVPEWYFLPFYAILRACPNKIGGVISMGGALLILLLLPLLDVSPITSAKYRFGFRTLIFLFIGCVIVLGFLGAQPAEGKYILMSKIASFFYFTFFFLVFLTSFISRFYFVYCTTTHLNNI